MTLTQLPTDVLNEMFQYLDFSSILACARVCIRCYRVSSSNRFYVRSQFQIESTVRSKIHKSQRAGQRKQIHSWSLICRIVYLLKWYTQHSLLVSERGLRSTTTQGTIAHCVNSRQQMVNVAKSQETLLRLHEYATSTQRLIVWYSLLLGFAGWEVFSAAPLIWSLSSSFRVVVEGGYRMIWGCVVGELVLLLSLFLCSAVRHMTVAALTKDPSSYSHLTLELIDVGQCIGAVLTSCAFIHVFEYVVTDRYDQIGMGYHLLYAVLVVICVWAGCSQLAKSFPHLMIPVGAVCAVCLISLPHVLMDAAASVPLRLLVMFALTPFNAFCVCIILNVFQLSVRMGTVISLLEGLRGIFYLSGWFQYSLLS
eukprot:PhF_6_TR35066/c0_g1_i1/m.51103